MSARNDHSEADRALLAAVARAHYLEGRSRIDIAETFGVSRFKVARLLARASVEGIVTIQVNDAGLPDSALAGRLGRALRLEECRVVRSHGDDDAVRHHVGAAAAALLSETLRPGEVLGVAWGRTLTATTSQLDHLPRLSVVQLTGVVARDIAASPIEVAWQVFSRSGGEVHPIFAPLFVPDAETSASLREHADVRSTTTLFPEVTTALLSVGSWNPPDTQLLDVLPPEVLARAAGRVAADIAGILVTGEGLPVDPALQDRCITISYEQLRAVPRVVAVAAGASKADAVRAVAQAGLITELVTDHTLALAILADADA
ncbi:MAG: transcriptional regulator [Intrasporangium sp.]|uniref:sugar-binding transcriptional regulator n=1 Tax=Intrasporangium sp. TaxID=1925024 RepID=UPI0026476A59|nr:sugar-binding domain-containing protein [Intrasporangium sp.]MDN5794351.1 transcriptional regulator [Intrasporangium sp.]